MAVSWQQFREPPRATIVRNGLIAIMAGAVLASFTGGLFRWPAAALLMLWPTFGGHALEVLFLNYIRPRISPARSIQVSARLLFWFFGGVLLGGLMTTTSSMLPGYRRFHAPAWWLCGIAFIGIELLAHLGIAMRRQSGFFNGRG